MSRRRTRSAVNGQFTQPGDDPRETVSEARRVKTQILPMELMATDRQGAGVWQLVARRGRRTVQLCECLSHESTAEAKACPEAWQRLAEGV